MINVFQRPLQGCELLVLKDEGYTFDKFQN